MQAELFAAQAELEMVEAELQKARAERQELQDLAARQQADFDNYRKRVERERGETYNRVVAEVVKQLLPVMDNLRRAHEAESSAKGTESQEFRNFLHGVELISKQLNGVLDSLGIEPVPTVGQRFDPHVHEAIATEQTDEFEPDTVMQEIVRGYRLGEKLLRPAMVKVATK
jgi:molecular chaperone GrpE